MFEGYKQKIMGFFKSGDDESSQEESQDKSELCRLVESNLSNQEQHLRKGWELLEEYEQIYQSEDLSPTEKKVELRRIAKGMALNDLEIKKEREVSYRSLFSLELRDEKRKLESKELDLREDYVDLVEEREDIVVSATEELSKAVSPAIYKKEIDSDFKEKLEELEYSIKKNSELEEGNEMLYV